MFFARQLRALDKEQFVFNFFPLLNRFAAVRAFDFHESLPLMAQAIPQTVQKNFNQKVSGISALYAALEIQTTPGIS